MENENNFSKFIVELYSNPELRKQFKDHPETTLKEQNIPWTEKRKIQVVEEMPNKKYFVLGPSEDLDEKSLLQSNLPENLKKFYIELARSPTLREALKKNPKTVFHSFQIDYPQNVEIEVLENTPSTIYWVLPDLSEVSDEALAQLSGGWSEGVKLWHSLMVLTFGGGPVGPAAGEAFKTLGQWGQKVSDYFKK